MTLFFRLIIFPVIVKLLLALTTLPTSSAQTTNTSPVTSAATNPTVTPASTTTMTSTTTQPPAETFIPRNTDIGVCFCDLLAGGCDVDCCCDPDCSDADRAVFSQCIDVSRRTRFLGQSCISSSVIFRNNAPFNVNISNPDFFCVQRDNFQSRNFFENLPILSTVQLVSESNSDIYSYSKSPINDVISTGFYKSGDVIYTIYPTNSLGRLGLPSPLPGSNSCFDTDFIGFLVDSSKSCTREFTQCESDLAINARTFFSNFRVIRSPVFLGAQSINISTTPTMQPTANPTTQATTSTPLPNDLYNSDAAVPFNITEVLCQTQAGQNISCEFNIDSIPSPTYNVTTATCQNALVQVEYRVFYNGTEGITDVTVRLIFVNIPSVENSVARVRQAFIVNFEQINDLANGTFLRSGNPGYQDGRPVMAGFFVQQGTSSAIELSTDRLQWFTMLRSTAAGNCADDPLERVSINFKENMRSGCFIRVNVTNLSSSCAQIQAVAQNALLGMSDSRARSQRVATFATSRVENTGDWVNITRSPNNPTTAQASQTDPTVCSNLELNMHTDVFYANTGARSNPQRKIVGVRRRFGSQDFRFLCSGPYCQPDSESLTQPIPVTSSVGFVDVSSVPEAVEAQQSSGNVRLPEDFFYPFN